MVGQQLKNVQLYRFTMSANIAFLARGLRFESQCRLDNFDSWVASDEKRCYQ